MTNHIHGHEVMQMMLELQQSFTDDTLKEAIEKRFGSDARFYTCSAENMTAEELIEFLRAKGKFSDVSGGFTTQPDKICQH